MESEFDVIRDRTSSEFLRGLKGLDEDSWQRLYTVYAPLVIFWGRQNSLPESEFDDLIQIVFSKLSNSISSFERENGSAKFRSFLKTITRNSCVDFHRRRVAPDGVGGSTAQHRMEMLPAHVANTETDNTGDEEKAILMAGIASFVRSKVKESTWLSFKRTELDGLNASEVAIELGITPESVRKNRQRVKRMIVRNRDDFELK